MITHTCFCTESTVKTKAKFLVCFLKILSNNAHSGSNSGSNSDSFEQPYIHFPHFL